MGQSTVNAVDRFVQDCKDYGIWDKLIDVCLFCGGNLEMALTRLKYPEGVPDRIVSAGFDGDSDYNETGANGGLLSSGSEYLDTGVLQADGSPKPTGALGFYGKYAPGSNAGGACLIGLGSGSDNVNFALRRTGTDGAQLWWGDPAQDTILNEDVPVQGFLLGSFDGLNARSLYLNGNVIASFPGTAHVEVDDSGGTGYFVFGRNDWNDGGLQEPAAVRGKFYCISEGLSPGQCQALYGAVQGFQVALGRAYV